MGTLWALRSLGLMTCRVFFAEGNFAFALWRWGTGALRYEL